MAERARKARRQAARDAEKLARDRARLAALEPGGSPGRPQAIVTAALVEVIARSLPCLACGGETHLEEHAVDGALRVAVLRCRRCGAPRRHWFSIVQPN